MPVKVTHNDEYLEVMLPRMIRAAGKRVAQGDVESLAPLVKLHELVDQAETVAVAGLLAEGYTMSEVARVLGISRQYAWRRYKHLQQKEDSA